MELKTRQESVGRETHVCQLDLLFPSLSQADGLFGVSSWQSNRDWELVRAYPQRPTFVSLFGNKWDRGIFRCHISQQYIIPKFEVFALETNFIRCWDQLLWHCFDIAADKLFGETLSPRTPRRDSNLVSFSYSQTGLSWATLKSCFFFPFFLFNYRKWMVHI